jgi:hypothetical protein
MSLGLGITSARTTHLFPYCSAASCLDSTARCVAPWFIQQWQDWPPCGLAQGRGTDVSILEFVSQDELDDLDEDPRVAFMQLVNLAQRSLSTRLSNLNPDEQYEWQLMEENKHTFMNVIIAAARRFEVEPFLSMDVPKYDDSRSSDYKQFKADLDHYITQLVLDNSLRTRQDSIAILPNSKDKIRTYVGGLSKCVENANMTEAKREALLKRLDAFEQELEKRRLNMMTVARFTYFILAMPGTIWGSIDIVQKLTTNIMQVVADAKAAEDEIRQLPAQAAPKALMPPRKPASPRPAAFDSDLDDDVPF